MEQITESYLKDKGACVRSYDWLKKQKNKEWKAIAKKLYAEEKYDWCLWLLYRKTLFVSVVLWGLVISSFILFWISFSISMTNKSNVAAIAIAIIVVIAIVVTATATAATVAIAGFVVTGATTTAITTANTAIAIAAAVAGATVVIAGVAAATTTAKWICSIIIKRL